MRSPTLTQLRERKFDKARIRIESVIRQEREHEAQEIIELMLEVLLSRIDLVAAEKTCPADMAESVRTVIWAVPRLMHVDELKVVREQLAYRYGDAFAAAAMKGVGVNEKVFARLSVRWVGPGAPWWRRVWPPVPTYVATTTTAAPAATQGLIPDEALKIEALVAIAKVRALPPASWSPHTAAATDTWHHHGDVTVAIPIAIAAIVMGWG